MASCATCNSFILFGGKKAEGFRFCNKKCLEKGGIYIEASKVTDAEIDALSREIHAGICPLCQERSGVEVRKSYDIASFVFHTRYQTFKHVCCRVCALKKQAIDFTGSLLLGWWGVPWGLLMTPVQLVNNVIAMLFPPNYDSPSQDLREAARMMIAQHKLDSVQQRNPYDPVLES